MTDKLITHDEARNTMIKIYIDDVYCGELEEEHKLMATYIAQQEKKDELLGLYKEKSLLLEVLFVNVDNTQINKYQMKGKSERYKRLEEILIRIETLEKELKEELE